MSGSSRSPSAYSALKDLELFLFCLGCGGIGSFCAKNEPVVLRYLGRGGIGSFWDYRLKIFNSPAG